MPDETAATGDWSRPDGALEPEDYVEEGSTSEPGQGQEGGDAPVDPLSPGGSVVGEGEDDGEGAVEPNEPG